LFVFAAIVGFITRLSFGENKDALQGNGSI
jgi:hypothetical protein